MTTSIDNVDSQRCHIICKYGINNQDIFVVNIKNRDPIESFLFTLGGT